MAVNVQEKENQRNEQEIVQEEIVKFGIFVRAIMKFYESKTLCCIRWIFLAGISYWISFGNFPIRKSKFKSIHLIE